MGRNDAEMVGRLRRLRGVWFAYPTLFDDCREKRGKAMEDWMCFGSIRLLLRQYATFTCPNLAMEFSHAEVPPLRSGSHWISS